MNNSPDTKLIYFSEAVETYLDGRPGLILETETPEERQGRIDNLHNIAILILQEEGENRPLLSEFSHSGEIVGKTYDEWKLVLANATLRLFGANR